MLLKLILKNIKYIYILNTKLSLYILYSIPLFLFKIDPHSFLRCYLKYNFLLPLLLLICKKEISLLEVFHIHKEQDGVRN